MIDALKEALRRARFSEELIDEIVGMMTLDDSGRVYISLAGIGCLCEILDYLEIPEGAVGLSLPVFRASFSSAKHGFNSSTGATTAVVFFDLPECFIGKRVDCIQIIKMLGSRNTASFKQVHALENLTDGCMAVVRVETIQDGVTLKHVQQAGDIIDGNSRLALAIRDGGPFDLDAAENGGVSDPAFIIEGTQKPCPPDDPQGGGCASAVFAPALLALLAPLILLFRGEDR